MILIFPEHCKCVAVFDSDKRDLSWVYFLTKYVIFLENSAMGVYEIETEGTGFFRDVSSLKKIASANETVILDDEFDLTDRTTLIEMADDICDSKINTVIFRGVAKHITFVHKPDLLEVTTIEVFDIIPPENPWLWYNIERLEKIGVLGELQLRFTPNILDLRQFEDPDAFVIFPCKVSNLNGYFLDSIKSIDDKKEVKLVGCDISKKTFETIFPQQNPQRYEFVNICPLHQIFKRPFIVRCCQREKSGVVTINGVKGVSVHSGATPLEIIDGIKLLASELK